MAQLSTAAGTDSYGRCGRVFTPGELCVIVARVLKRCQECANAEGYAITGADQPKPINVEVRRPGFEPVGAVGETVKRYWWERSE